MIIRLCEQQAAVSAVLYSHRDLVHLEHSPTEWHLLEDLADVLQPFMVATKYLSAENYPSLSALGPLLNQMKNKVCVPSGTNDSAGIRLVKKAIANDLDKKYQDLSVKMLMK